LIVVDTSALVAILADEPEGVLFDELLRSEPSVAIGPPTLFELNMVAASKKHADGLAIIAGLLEAYRIETRDWGVREAQLALDAFLRFGKGRHPAKLNFGDCMAYALAKSLDAPLLFKGGDFAATDVRRAVG
jgi:ribonuclease VapC